MATQELKTRIALKYDTYANWINANTAGKGANLVLLKGELGICEIPVATDSKVTTAPTVLFKVGDGVTPFSGLKWASALAADVHEWAKAETAILNGKTLQFKTGDTVKHSIDLSTFATNADLDSAIARIAAIEGSIGSGGSVTEEIGALEARLDTLENSDPNVTGSIAQKLAGLSNTINGNIDRAISTAKAYTDTEVAKDRERLATLEGANEDLSALISANTAAIEKETGDRSSAISDLNTAYKAADKEIADKIGEGFTSTNTVEKAINKLKTDLDINSDGISKNANNIQELKAGLSDEKSARVSADNAINERLGKIEVFFEAADHDGEDGGLYDALDTLVEIQEYISNEGAAADAMLKDIAANASAIEALQNIVEDGGTLEVRVDSAEADIVQAEADITELKRTVAGYSSSYTINSAIEAINDRVTEAKDEASTAKAAADKAKNDLEALSNIVNHATSGLAATKTIADNNATDIASLKTRVGTAESNISALDAIVKTGNDANTKLRTDITALQTLTGDTNKGNEKLRSDLDTIKNTVDNTAISLATIKATADDAKSQADTNKTDIAAIKADYLKATDIFVFNCGNATEVTT